MTVKILSIGLRGLEGYRVQVEVQEVPGIAAMVIVGLPDASVKEAKERVLASLYAFGCDFLIKGLLFICLRRSGKSIARCLIWRWRLGF